MLYYFINLSSNNDPFSNNYFNTLKKHLKDYTCVDFVNDNE